MSKPQIILLTKDGHVTQVVIRNAPTDADTRQAIERLCEAVVRVGAGPQVIAFSDDYDVEIR